MQYVLDTVTVVRHFSGNGKIGQGAADILDGIETRDDLLIISIISLMEILYLSEKNRIDMDALTEQTTQQYRRGNTLPG